MRSTGRECIITRRFGEMPRVVQGKNTDVVSASDVKAVDAAIRGNDPWGLLRILPDRTHQMKRKKADRTRVRVDDNATADMLSKNGPELGRASPKEMPITFAVRYHVMDVPIYERVVVLREGLF